MNACALTLFLVWTAFTEAQAGPEFGEVNGRIVAEAENATSHSWKVIDGKSGKALEDPGNGSIEFTFHFAKTGKYYLAILGGTNVCGGDKANDAFVKVNGEKLYGSDGKTRPDGMRFGNDWCTASKFQWSQIPKGPGGHTPTNIKNNPVYALVTKAGKGSLVLTHRSTGTRIDKVVMNYDKAYKPSGTGPAETVLGTTGLAPAKGAFASESANPLLMRTDLLGRSIQNRRWGVIRLSADDANVADKSIESMPGN